MNFNVKKFRFSNIFFCLIVTVKRKLVFKFVEKIFFYFIKKSHETICLNGLKTTNTYSINVPIVFQSFTKNIRKKC